MAYNGALSKRMRMDQSGESDYLRDDSNHSDEFKRRKRPDNPENCVLLYTIFNACYPITTDVIHTISSPSGKVNRIVIFKKTGVQAMVEFDSIESARRAKDALNGADIYSGCCTLKIEYAKPTRLNVHKNDSESWDYTLPGGNEGPNKKGPLLQSPRMGSAPQPYRSDTYRTRRQFNENRYSDHDSYDDYTVAGQDIARGSYNERFPDYPNNGPNSQYPSNGPQMGNFNGPDRYNDRFKGNSGAGDGDFGPGGGGGGRPGNGGFSPAVGAAGVNGPNNQSGPGCVMMVYGLDLKRVNCDRLFNLFCLYGNVARVKFLKTKEGAAMIQMGDGYAVERCIKYLNNTPLFSADNRLQLGFSKQPFLAEVLNPFNLPDGTPSFKDFIGSKHNRFSNMNANYKNRIQPPSKILHFFNTPPNIEKETLLQVFKQRDIKMPVSIKIFPMKSEKSSSGLLEFEDIQTAMETLIELNHAPVENPNGKFPFTMKLCFSSSKQIMPNFHSNQNGSA